MDEREIHRELRESDASKRVARINYLMLSFDIYQRNFHDLETLLEDHNSFDCVLRTRGTRGRRELTEMQLELIRHIYNTVVSAMSLRDHARELRKSIAKDGRDTSFYDAEIKRRFETNPLAQFLQDFRNFLAHYGMPPTSTVTGSRLSQKLLLESDRLLGTSYKWKSQAKGYLKAHPDGIDVQECVRDYNRSVVEFYDGLSIEYRRLYAEEHQLKSAYVEYWLPLEGGFSLRMLKQLSDGYTVSDVLKCFSQIISAENEEKILARIKGGVPLDAILLAVLKEIGLSDPDFLAAVEEYARHSTSS